MAGGVARKSEAARRRARAAPTAELSPLQESALRRMQHALQEVVTIAPESQLYEALGTKTPIDALIHLVGSGSVIAEAASRLDDPLRAARSRAAKRMAELLSAEGGPVGVEAMAERLRISRAAVDKRRRAGTLIGLDDGGRRVLYPGWQLTATGLLRGLEDVLRAMNVADPWMRMEFFLTPDPELQSRPLDALRRGQIAAVIAAARRYGRQGDDG